MTLDTATIERFTTTTAALTPITETPVVRACLESERHSPGTFMVYVTALEVPADDHNHLIGTVVKVSASPSMNGWLHTTDGPYRTIRVFGAPLNPEMENGKHYRQLGERNIMARFNDDDHRGDRNNPTAPLSLISGAGAPWPFPGDSMGMWDASVPYIEVEGPSTPEPMDVQQFADADMLAASGPAHGFALREADGNVLLNPELEVGEFYIYWTTSRAWADGSMSEARMVTAIEDGTPRFAHFGYWTMERVAGELVPYFYTSRRTVLDSEPEKGWVKLALTVPAATNIDTTVWANRAATERGEFAEFNEATNELARDNDWCSEYEGIVEALGMEGRTKQLYDFDIDVAVDFSFDVDSVSSQMDSRIATDYDIPGFSGSSARLTGTATVTIRISEQEDESDAHDQIDSEAVETELSNMMSGDVDSIDISDWTIGNTRQVN